MSRCVDGSSSSRSSAAWREAGRQQHPLPLAAAQRRSSRSRRSQQSVRRIARSTASAILVGFEPAIGVRIPSHQHAARRRGTADPAAPTAAGAPRSGRAPRASHSARAADRRAAPSPRVDVLRPGDDVEQRALAGAVAAHDHGQLRRCAPRASRRTAPGDRRPATRRRQSAAARSSLTCSRKDPHNTAATHSAASTTRGLERPARRSLPRVPVASSPPSASDRRVHSRSLIG